MRNKILIICVLLLCSTGGVLHAQLSGTFSFGSIASPENNITVFSGPMVIAADTSCLRVANGVVLAQLTFNPYDKFALDCVPLNNKDKPQFYLYPNPANDKIRLLASGFNSLTQEITLTIHDVAGRMIRTQPTSVSQLYNGLDFTIHSLPSGIYFITVYTTQQQYTLRFVKAKN